jgi:hypothetical protein
MCLYMEPSFISEMCEFCVRNIIYWPQKSEIKIRFSLVIGLSYLMCFIRSWLGYHSHHIISCLRKTQFKALFSSIWKSLINIEHEHRVTYDETFFYTVHRIYFHVTVVYEHETHFWMILPEDEHNWELCLQVICTCITSVRNLSVREKVSRVLVTCRLADTSSLNNARSFSSPSDKVGFVLRRRHSIT